MPKPRFKSRRERITFQAPTTAKSDYGQDKVTGYAPVTGLVKIHADFTHTGGTETFRGRQIEANVQGVFEIRLPRVAIDPKWRIVHVTGGNKVYEIVSARPAEYDYEGGDKFMWVFVRGLA